MAQEVRGAGFTSDKIRAETSSNGSEVRGAGFTPHKIHVETLWISGLFHLGPKGVLALPLREGSLRFDTEPTPHHSAYFSPSCYLSIYCSGRIVVAALYCRTHAVTYGSIDVTTYGSIDVMPATQLFKQPSTLFRGHRPKHR